MKKNLTCCPECQRAFPTKRYLLRHSSGTRMRPSEVFFWTLLFFIAVFAAGAYFWDWK